MELGWKGKWPGKSTNGESNKEAVYVQHNDKWVLVGQDMLEKNNI